VNYPKIQVDEDDLAMLFYTGGTTGVPKGSMHTHEGIINVVMNLQSEYLQLNRTDTLLSPGSLAHANGFRAILCFLEGAKFIIPEAFLPKEILETIEREKVTVLCTVPTTLIRLSSSPDFKKYDLNCIRLVTYGAAPMPTDKLKEVLKTFGNRLAQSYGQAEALMAITHLSKEDHMLEGSEKDVRKLASAGRPYSTVEVRIVDDQGEDVKPGGVGELIVKGKITMKGYWNNPEATAETIKDGWIYTGDIGTADEDGYIYLIDRKKDIIISGGYNIYAREVEDLLHAHPAIAEAAVIGVPDDECGESVKAVVTLKPGMSATEEEIIQFCKERLSSFKKPKSVDFVAELPKTSIGKISKKDLRAKYWEGQERAIH
jgi:acyl-CoA synthetase (AMP-forming)/AMP-acid ligase II